QPKLQIEYALTKPMAVRITGDVGSLVEKNGDYRQDNRFTYWEEGALTLKVTDAIANTLDNYTIVLRSGNVIDIAFKDFQDTYYR
ncbi:MAG TPA: hypothetical protein VIQ97_03140, partial [Prevotella sp.]